MKIPAEEMCFTNVLGRSDKQKLNCQKVNTIRGLPKSADGVVMAIKKTAAETSDQEGKQHQVSWVTMWWCVWRSVAPGMAAWKDAGQAVLILVSTIAKVLLLVSTIDKVLLLVSTIDKVLLLISTIDKRYQRCFHTF